MRNFAKQRFCRTVLFIVLTGISISTLAQDNWTGINLPVPVKEYAGNKFRYTVAMKTDGSPVVLAMAAAQVTRASGEWGYFNHGGDQPVSDTSWTIRKLEGSLDNDAAMINLGLTCMGNGTAFYDNVQLEIELSPGKWTQVRLDNGGFEEGFTGTLPTGWVLGKPSPGFILNQNNFSAYRGTAALSITGFGHDDVAPVSFMKAGAYAREHYDKFEYMIPMRDGIKLFTAVYVPKDASSARRYPVMLRRTTYSVGPYGKDNYPHGIAPNPYMAADKYIFVHQDVRGRFKSEGTFTNMTPHISNKKSKNDVDESSDAWDTIDWLLKNLQHTNGRVGMWGISYPGFYVSAGSIDAHPALKAVSPQAPVADYFFDDFHHNGAFTQAYFPFFPIVGEARKEPTDRPWYNEMQTGTADGYNFFRRLGPLSAAGDSLLKNNQLWQEIVDHPDYDKFWKSRRITDHLVNLKPAFLVVGGWFDAEDLYGTLTTYKRIEQANKGTYNTLVMGPFGHGDWSYETGKQMHHQLYFGDSLSSFYQEKIETPFFRHFLKGSGSGEAGLPEAYMFNTGKKSWETFTSWPAPNVSRQRLYFQENGKVSLQQPARSGHSGYISDPAKPVPYTADIAGSLGTTPRNYMSEDQRFVSSRPDVLVFETPVLTDDLTIGGEIRVKLHVSSTGTDADWVVKLVDVYPDDEPNTPHTPKGVTLSGYQQLVRGEVMRSRWRRSFEKAEPLVPGKIETISFQLPDVLHTFRKGHRIMIQVQSSWYPLIDMNPQKFVPNIYKAKSSDFIKATQKLYHGGATSSYVEVDVLK